jgi:broad specificity phosphatase PhoE
MVIVVRHAERDGAADALSDDGKARAEHLATLFERMQLDALIASDRQRTQDTLGPLAAAKELEITTTDDTSAAAVDTIRKLPPGSKAVVAHHSYTIAGILDELGATKTRIAFPGGYDNAWVLLLGPGKDAQMVPLKYGCPSVIPDTCP